jgi:hypothetical protein
MLIPLVLMLAGEPPKPLMEYPHPLITEVLYAVPTGETGDVTGDGTRETNGDEFVELTNPHGEPINLRGYVLSGKSDDDPRRKFKTLRFVFPPLTLRPGEVVVVFNGHEQKWTGPIGDTTRGPSAGNEKFFDARVFTMNVDSARLGFANKADYVLLSSPSGRPLHCISWGDIKTPEHVGLVEKAPENERGSVMRRTMDGELEPHPPIEGKRYSPGRFPLDMVRPSEAKPEEMRPIKIAPAKPIPPRPTKKGPAPKPAPKDPAEPAPQPSPEPAEPAPAEPAPGRTRPARAAAVMGV